MKEITTARDMVLTKFMVASPKKEKEYAKRAMSGQSCDLKS